MQSEDDRWLVDLDAAYAKWRAAGDLKEVWLTFLVAGVAPKKRRERIARAIRAGKLPVEVREQVKA